VDQTPPVTGFSGTPFALSSCSEPYRTVPVFSVLVELLFSPARSSRCFRAVFSFPRPLLPLLGSRTLRPGPWGRISQVRSFCFPTSQVFPSVPPHPVGHSLLAFPPANVPGDVGSSKESAESWGLGYPVFAPVFFPSFFFYFFSGFHRLPVFFLFGGFKFRTPGTITQNFVSEVFFLPCALFPLFLWTHPLVLPFSEVVNLR